MIQAARDFLVRCPMVVRERDPAWDIVGTLQRSRLVRLEWINTRVARVWPTDAGYAELKKEPS